MTQFSMSGFSKPHTLDCSLNGGENLQYVRDNIPSRMVTEYKVPEETECIFVELNEINQNGCCATLITLIWAISLDLGFHHNLLVLGFNSKISEKYLDDFCNLVNLFDIMIKAACLQNPNKPSSIDFF